VVESTAQRQAIFPEDQTTLRKASSSITGDVGGPDWNFKNNSGSTLHLEMAVYTNLWQDERTALWMSLIKYAVPKVPGPLSHVATVVQELFE